MIQIIRIEEISSTNDFLKNHPCSGDPSEIVVATAQFQTAGRGQSGAWISDRGKNLVFSVRVQPTALKASDGFIISQANALALKETIDEALSKHVSVDVWIKWPNDIYIDGHKVCGTLIENSLAGKNIQNSIIGTGININQTEFPDGLAAPASSLKIISGCDIDCEEILEKFLQRFEHYYNLVQNGNWREIREAYLKSLYLRGQEHSFQDQNGPFLGTIQGVEPDGHLIIIDDTGKERKYGFKEVRTSPRRGVRC